MPSMGVSSCGPEVRATGAPTSATVIARSSSTWPVMASLSWRRHRTRNATSVDHVVSSNARRAAPMAASMSASVPSAATPITCSVVGFTFSNVAPLGGRHQGPVDEQALLPPHVARFRSCSHGRLLPRRDLQQ